MSQRSNKHSPVARAIAIALGVSSVSPMAARSQSADTELEEVVVTGTRAALESAMDLKRESWGVVDGIVAEDIGKFPDTNLAEALQRISGVSIDRSIGEGSRVTVRGVGPDYNLVLLNGRQMPASSIADTAASGSRAFDFANLASEAISAVEVFKTARAEQPTGGIGAVINIKTARPLESPGMRADINAKAVLDQSADNLPKGLENDGLTPEISGIYSDTFADDTFGVAISASYQERKLGYNQAATANGWRPFKGDEVNWGTIPLPGQPGSQPCATSVIDSKVPCIDNRPGAKDVYSVPQNLLYSFNSIDRTRTNGQAVLQYRPVESFTATLDYTYSENKIETNRNELSAWFNFGPSASSWTDGPVAGPNVYSELIGCVVPGSCSDLAMAGAEFATKNTGDSTGINLNWRATDQLGFQLDAHTSSAESGEDSPYGSNAALGTAGFFRGTTTADYTRDLPVLSVVLPPSMNGQIDPALMKATGSSFRNSYMKSDIDQVQLSGDFVFADESRLDFGVGYMEAKNRSAFSNVQQDSWGGVGNPADYPDSAFRLNRVRPFFNNLSGSSNPNLFNQFFTWNFNTIRQAAIDVTGCPTCYEKSNDFTTDRRSTEDTSSAYLQYRRAFDMDGWPANVVIGLRYENTDVTSRALVPLATGNWWQSANEFTICTTTGNCPNTQKGDAGFTQLKGSYDYLLPSIDFAVNPFDRDDLKARASYSQTISRPTWDQIQGGQTLNTLARIDGGDGAQGNPGLLPLESWNTDLSVEWYFAEGSYVSAGYFHKNISNYIGVGQINETPFDLPNPGQGPWVKEAIANGGPLCATGDINCIRNYIFANHTDYTGPASSCPPSANVCNTGTANGQTTGIIKGRAGIDPLTNFKITLPSNERSAVLYGWEFAGQYMFGGSGFGVAGNFTYVASPDLKYENGEFGNQFALVGLSNSANFVGFWEKYNWDVRLAYNWRDEFLAATFDGVGPNPVYTEAYGQWDADVSYGVTDNFEISLEAINLTDETQRSHSRTQNQVEYVTQSGTRYMIGARYKFGR